MTDTYKTKPVDSGYVDGAHHPNTEAGRWTGPFSNNSAEFFGDAHMVRPSDYDWRKWVASYDYGRIVSVHDSKDEAKVEIERLVREGS